MNTGKTVSGKVAGDLTAVPPDSANPSIHSMSPYNDALYLRILQDAPALIWRAGTDGKCDWFNKSWLEFTGRTMEQEQGDGWAEGVHPEDFDFCLKTYLEAFAARRTFRMEYRLRDAGGAWKWILDFGRPFRDSDGNFLGYIGYCFDISEQKATDRTIQEQLLELKRWHEITLGREARVTELKSEVNELLHRLGESPRYVTGGLPQDKAGASGAR